IERTSVRLHAGPPPVVPPAPPPPRSPAPSPAARLLPRRCTRVWKGYASLKPQRARRQSEAPLTMLFLCFVAACTSGYTLKKAPLSREGKQSPTAIAIDLPPHCPQHWRTTQAPGIQAMRATVSVDQLNIDKALYDFVNGEAIPGSGVQAQEFWSGFAALVRAFAPRNAALLRRRDELQAKIDAW